MLSLFRLSPTEVFIDSLIVQPTAGCGRSCSRCYCKEHHINEETNWFAFFDLFFNFISKQKPEYKCNQISLSIDDLPAENENNHKIRYKMRQIADSFLATNSWLKARGDKEDTEFHICLHSPDTILQYESIPLKMFADVDVIYFSHLEIEHIEILEQLRAENKNLKIGFNFLTEDNRTIPAAIIEHIDIFHNIINKKVAPRKNPIFMFRGENCLTQKEPTDICFKDYITWRKDWHTTTCSANISKFTVWPDGSVSGCPYAKVSDTGPGKNTYEILQNIIESSKKYNFNECPLKELIK